MNSKLTLRLEDHLIRSAKTYAARTGKSVSRIVADYFTLIDSESSAGNKEISPTIRSLKGVLKGNQLSVEDYHRHLMEKHL